MSQVLHARRPVYTVDLPEGRSVRLAPQTFAPTHIMHVIFVNPQTLLEAAECKPGLLREPIGEALQAYRFDKAFKANEREPMTIPTGLIDTDTNNEIRKLVLYDEADVRFLVGKGAREIPVVIMSHLEEAVLKAARILGSDKPVIPRERSNIYIYDDSKTRSLSADIETSSTYFITINDLEESIDAHIRNLEFDLSYKSELDDDFYQKFSDNPALLDTMIVMGLSGALVHVSWDGESMRQGMEDAINSHRAELEADNIGAMELVDRYARLYERYLQYTQKPDYIRVIDTSAEQRIRQFCEFIGERIACNPEALKLANSELSYDAQTHLQEHLGGDVNFSPHVAGDDPALSHP